MLKMRILFQSRNTSFVSDAHCETHRKWERGVVGMLLELHRGLRGIRRRI